MTEQNNELAIAAFKKGDFALPCENADELYHLRYLKDTYSLLSQLIIEGYDFKPDSLDNPVILRKFPDFIPTRIPALWQTLECHGNHCTNTLCPDIKAVVDKAVGIRRLATEVTPEYCCCDPKAKNIARHAFEAALRVLWFLREDLEGRPRSVGSKEINPFELGLPNLDTYNRGFNDEFYTSHGISYWQGQIDAIFEKLPVRPLENSDDIERFRKIVALARDLKLTPGSKPTVIDYPFEGNIRGTLWLSLLFASLGGLEHATAEDLLIALKAICPDVQDWDSAIGGLYRH